MKDNKDAATTAQRVKITVLGASAALCGVLYALAAFLFHCKAAGSLSAVDMAVLLTGGCAVLCLIFIMLHETGKALALRDRMIDELQDRLVKNEEETSKAAESFMQTEKLASLGRLAAGVAHEINNPLTGIMIFSDLLMKRLPPEKATDQEDLQIIIEQAEKCSRIVAVLLGYSRAIPSQHPDMNINDTVEAALALVRNQAKFADVSVKMELDASLPRVPGDALQLEQVCVNLLINAADAMDNHGAVYVSTAMAEKDGKNQVRIQFTDTGPGIPKDMIDKIFEPFYTTKPEGKGTGLGLAVSKGIVVKAGGTITVENRPGKGASFLIHLPAAK